MIIATVPLHFIRLRLFRSTCHTLLPYLMRSVLFTHVSVEDERFLSFYTYLMISTVAYLITRSLGYSSFTKDYPETQKQSEQRESH